MRRVGVCADTHSYPLPQQMLDDFKDVDLIVHVGDFCDVEDYKLLTRLKEVKGTFGNMDMGEITRQLPEKHIFAFEGFNIGLTHGTGSPNQVFDRVQELFKNEKVDVVVFGHSHHPLNEKVGDVLYFNPGSPTDRVFSPYRSYGFLEFNGQEVLGKIVKVDD